MSPTHLSSRSLSPLDSLPQHRTCLGQRPAGISSLGPRASAAGGLASSCEQRWSGEGFSCTTPDWSTHPLVCGLGRGRRRRWTGERVEVDRGERGGGGQGGGREREREKECLGCSEGGCLCVQVVQVTVWKCQHHRNTVWVS